MQAFIFITKCISLGKVLQQLGLAHNVCNFFLVPLPLRFVKITSQDVVGGESPHLKTKTKELLQKIRI